MMLETESPISLHSRCTMSRCHSIQHLASAAHHCARVLRHLAEPRRTFYPNYPCFSCRLQWTIMLIFTAFKPHSRATPFLLGSISRILTSSMHFSCLAFAGALGYGSFCGYCLRTAVAPEQWLLTTAQGRYTASFT